MKLHSLSLLWIEIFNFCAPLPDIWNVSSFIIGNILSRDVLCVNELMVWPVAAVYRSSVNTPIWRRNFNQPQSWGCCPNCWTWRTPAVKQRAGSSWRWPSSVTVRQVCLWLRRFLKHTAAPWTQRWDRGLMSCSTSARILSYEARFYLGTPAWNPWR